MRRAPVLLSARRSQVHAFSILGTWTALLIAVFALLPCSTRNAFSDVPGASGERTPVRVSLDRALATGPAQWLAEGAGVLAYGAANEAHFLSEDDHFAEVSRLVLRDPVSDAVITGRFAYLAQPGLGLRVVDLVDPAAPVDLGLVPLQGRSFRLAQAGDRLLVAAEGYGLSVLDLAGGHVCAEDPDSACAEPVDPFDIREIGFLRFADAVSAVAASDSSAYLALGTGGIAVVDFSDPARPVETRRMLPGVVLSAMTVNGDMMLAGTLANDVRVLDTSRGEFADVFPGLRTPARALLLEGRTLFVAAGTKGLLRAETATPLATTVNVNVGNIFFNPSSVTLHSGDSVTWKWVGGTHSSTSGLCSGGCVSDGIWDSGVKSSGTFTRTFGDVGDFHYFCSVHGSSMTGVVHVQGPAALFASASASIAGGASPLSVTFGSQASGGTPPYSFAWDFGDGAASTEAQPVHTYAAPGTYSAALVVHDSAGGTAAAAPLAIVVTASGALAAAATATPTSGSAPLAVNFSGSASGGTPPYTFAWSFDDGATSTVQNPAHSFSTPGTYHVGLAVSDAVGATALASHLTVTVTSVPPPVVRSLVKKGKLLTGITVTGSNLQKGMQVFIDGTRWAQVTWKSASKVLIKGGTALRNVVPRDTPTAFHFLNPDGGEATTTFQWR